MSDETTETPAPAPAPQPTATDTIAAAIKAIIASGATSPTRAVAE